MTTGNTQKIKAERLENDFKTIVSVVGFFFELNNETIISPKNRFQKIVHARSCVMFLATRYLPTLTKAALGKLLGTDHTGVFYGLKRLNEKIISDKKIASEISMLEQLLSEKMMLVSDVSISSHSSTEIRSVGGKVWEDLNLGKLITKEDFCSYLDYIYSTKSKQE